MALSPTLTRYLGREAASRIGVVLVIVMALVFFIDFVEMVRQHTSEDKISIPTTIGLSMLKMPHLMQELFPFTFLFGAMWAFNRLTRNSELIVTRAAGVSVWQFLGPSLMVAFVCGLTMVLIWNPLSSVTAARFAQLESRLLKGQESQIRVSAGGLWLRQSENGQQAVIHALSVQGEESAKTVRLSDVIIWGYDTEDRLRMRIDGARAALVPGAWRIEEAWVTPAGEPGGTYHAVYDFPTSLTQERIQEGFAPPRTLSVFDLPNFIRAAESAGFRADQHLLHWHTILSTPLLLCAMVFIAATFSLRQIRSGRVAQLVIAGILSGFALFFASRFFGALGQSGILPPALAAWAPASIAMLLGITMLLYLEDG